jgi:hypothetical protein
LAFAPLVHAETVITSQTTVAGETVSPQSRDVMPAPVRSADKQKSPAGLAAKIIAPLLTPLVIGIGELRHPVTLLKSATAHLWSVSVLRWGDTSGESLVSDTESNPFPLDISFALVRPFRLSAPSNVQNGSVDLREDNRLATLAHARPVPLARNSAAQLNLRVSSGMSLLAEVDRSEVVVGDSEVGVGLGFKLVF